MNSRDRLKYSLLSVSVAFTMVLTSSHVGARVQLPESARPRILTEDEILKLLPPGARFADDMPIVQPEEPRDKRKERQEYVYYADVDSDEEDEIVVAYYAEPHEYIEPKREEDNWAAERFFSRAHVAVLDWDGLKYVFRWDSGGFGDRFQATAAGPVPKDKRDYALNSFSVRDINGDDRPEILATRAKYREMIFLVWRWDGKEYVRIARLNDMQARTEDLDNDGVQEIICDRVPRFRRQAPPIIYRWNGTLYEQKRK